MTKALPYIFQGSNIVIVHDNMPYTICQGDLNYKKVLDAMKVSDWELVIKNLLPAETVKNFSKESTVIDGVLYWNGQEVKNGISKVMVKMLTEGFDAAPLENFMRNLYKNPSKRAVDELYNFIEAGNMPITSDGHFLAYKKVREDYLDVHSGTIDNSVGQVVSMERNAVDEDKNNTCSYGLHFCSFDYLRSFSGTRVVILKINPADVVAVPADYNDTKGRCCRYEVIGEVPKSDFGDDVLSESSVMDSLDDDPYEGHQFLVTKSFLDVILADTSMRDLYNIVEYLKYVTEMSADELMVNRESNRRVRSHDQGIEMILERTIDQTEEEFVNALDYLVSRCVIQNRYGF